MHGRVSALILDYSGEFALQFFPERGNTEKISWTICIAEIRGKSGGENIIRVARLEKGPINMEKSFQPHLS